MIRTLLGCLDVRQMQLVCERKAVDAAAAAEATCQACYRTPPACGHTGQNRQGGMLYFADAHAIIEINVEAREADQECTADSSTKDHSAVMG